MDWGIDTDDLGPVEPGPGHVPAEPEDQEIPVDSRVWVKQLTGDGSTIGEALLAPPGQTRQQHPQ